MACLLARMLDVYDDLFQEFSDPKVKDCFLMGSPWPLLSILAVYYYFIHYGGKTFMENRKPYNLEKLLLAYNFMQIFINLYLVTLSIDILLNYDGSYFCFVVEYPNSKIPEKLKRAMYLYFLTKVIELADTVFMVLKKNFHQVSFLHVYHHMGMAVASWIIAKFSCGGQEGMIGTLNVYVHVLMYTYYFLSAKYPQIKKLLWMKKMVTQVQLLQFVIVLFHNTGAYFNPNCRVTKWPLLIFISQALVMIYLFSNFYYNAYIVPERKKNQHGTNGIKNKVQ